MSARSRSSSIERLHGPSGDTVAGVQFVDDATSNYTAEDAVVRVKVGGEIFCVAKSRLTMRSPVLTIMFSLPQTGSSEPIELQNDVQDFRDYLWFIHADPLSADKFRSSPDSPHKCTKLLGIASVAHMYEAVDVADWTMGRALDMLACNRAFTIDGALARHLLSTSSRWGSGVQPDVLRCARDVVCDAMHPSRPGPLSADPVSALLIANAVGDPFVAGHAYYYVLRKGDAAWKNDPRLEACERRHLMCGSHALSERARTHENNARYGGTRMISVTMDLKNPVDKIVGEDLPQWTWWVPQLDREIAGIRDELWALFDSAPWRLTD